MTQQQVYESNSGFGNIQITIFTHNLNNWIPIETYTKSKYKTYYTLFYYGIQYIDWMKN